MPGAILLVKVKGNLSSQQNTQFPVLRLSEQKALWTQRSWIAKGKGPREALVTTFTEIIGPWMKHLLTKLSSIVLFILTVLQWSRQEQLLCQSPVSKKEMETNTGWWRALGHPKPQSARCLVLGGTGWLHGSGLQAHPVFSPPKQMSDEWALSDKRRGLRYRSSLRVATKVLFLESSLEPRCCDLHLDIRDHLVGPPVGREPGRSCQHPLLLHPLPLLASSS